MDKLKLASSSITERLRTSSAQMSRLVSTKFHDLIATPTPESKMVDSATLPEMENPDWGINMRIYALIESEEFNGTEVVKTIKRKITSGKGVMLCLELLEMLCSNCEKVFSEVAAEKVVEEVARVVEDRETEEEVRQKAMQLVKAWGENDDLAYLPVFRETYMNLKTREVTPPGDGDFPMQYSLESLMNQPHLTPQENYPLPDLAAHGGNNVLFSYGSQSVEEKKEILEITRNSLDILSSIMNSGTEPKPKDDLTVSMLEKCKQSLPAVQMIAESTTDDDVMLFEALNLHDQLQQIISKFDEMDVAPAESLESVAAPPENTVSAENFSVVVGGNEDNKQEFTGSVNGTGKPGSVDADNKPQEVTGSINETGRPGSVDADNKQQEVIVSVTETEKPSSVKKEGADPVSSRAI